jgi:hypothetical protein
LIKFAASTTIFEKLILFAKIPSILPGVGIDDPDEGGDGDDGGVGGAGIEGGLKVPPVSPPILIIPVLGHPIITLYKYLLVHLLMYHE